MGKIYGGKYNINHVSRVLEYYNLIKYDYYLQMA